jgi:UDP-N-acetylglucosamine--N-acetylmuramyl-(pentapeptide) pyrophosphoryl-undecaprenol N-acetylglucosamine transferase
VRVLLAAGGTGGHVTPAIATAEAIVAALPSASVLFVTDGRPVAEKFFSRVRFGREHLFPDHTTAPKKSDVSAWFHAYRRARAILRDFEPDVVAGFGGYPTFIVGAAALGSPFVALARLATRTKSPSASFPSRAPRHPPLVLLEQNAHPGRAVKFFQGVSERVLLSFAAARERLDNQTITATTGNPLPASFSAGEVASDPASFGLEPGRPTLLVLGGSQGARGVNKLVLGARAELARQLPQVQILFIAGDLDYADVCAEVEKAPLPRTIVLPFEHRMREAYEIADLVVCRAGGTTLAELAIVGKPMVLIPYPYHKDHHQRHNAKAFADVGAATIVEEGNGASDAFRAALMRWLTNEAARERAVRAARTLGRPNAAHDAAEQILAIGGYQWN